MSNTHCPACGQRIVQPAKRMCADCGKSIARHDKYFFGTDGRIRHRVCEEPTHYARTGKQPQTPPLLEAQA